MQIYILAQEHLVQRQAVVVVQAITTYLLLLASI
jgi:hypothetical protein